MRTIVALLFILFSFGLSAQIKAPVALTQELQISTDLLDSLYESNEQYRSYAISNIDTVDHAVRYRERTKVNGRPVIADHYFFFKDDVFIGYRAMLMNTYNTEYLAPIREALGKGMVDGSSLIVNYHD